MTEIPASIRGELDVTPAWWDRQYQALIRKQIPRNAAWHDGHNVAEYRTYFSTTVRGVCVDCGIELDPYEEGP